MRKGRPMMEPWWNSPTGDPHGPHPQGDGSSPGAGGGSRSLPRDLTGCPKGLLELGSKRSWKSWIFLRHVEYERISKNIQVSCPTCSCDIFEWLAPGLQSEVALFSSQFRNIHLWIWKHTSFKLPAGGSFLMAVSEFQESNKKICLTMLTLPMKNHSWDSPHNFNTVSVGCRPSFYHGWAMPTWLEVHLQAPKSAILPASQVAQWDFNSIPTNKSVNGIMASNQITCRAQAWAADSLTLAMEIRQDHRNFWITATQNNHH